MVNATTSLFARWKSHLTNWREWEFNPVVIKELRQGVRSWTVTGMLLLFLVVLFIASLGFLVTQSFDVSPNMGLGGSMFSTFVMILAGASVFFIPLYTGVRVAVERVEHNQDLLYVTSLSPSRIIFGKFLCSAYIAVLFFSACMPFMAFTNLLRGVDLPTVFLILFFLFLVVCAANMIAIFFACLPVSRPFKVLFVIYGIFQAFGIMGSLVGISFEIMRSGVGAMMAGRDFWIGVTTAVGVGLLVMGLFFVLSVALIAPPSANRALPVRIYLTVAWLFGGVLSVWWAVKTGEPQILGAWVLPTFVVMVVALLVVISNNDELSLRVRRTIPQSRFQRFLAFFFYNGAAGGLVWVTTILVATWYVTETMVRHYASRSGYPVPDRHWYGVTMTYALAYGLTALFLQRTFFRSRPAKLTGLLALMLAGGWALVPSIVLFFMNQLSWKSIDGLQLGNIFNVFALRDEVGIGQQQLFAFCWLVVAVIFNAGWFLRQVKYFQPVGRPVTDSPPPSPAAQ
jgi:hypothetical protein